MKRVIYILAFIFVLTFVFILTSVSAINLQDWCNGADITRDGKVSIGDVSNLANQYGKNNCNISNSFCERADINFDRFVNLGDLNALSTNYGKKNCVAPPLSIKYNRESYNDFYSLVNPIEDSKVFVSPVYTLFDMRVSGGVHNGIAECFYKINNLTEIRLNISNTLNGSQYLTRESLFPGEYKIEFRCTDSKNNKANMNVNFNIDLIDEMKIRSRSPLRNVSVNSIPKDIELKLSVEDLTSNHGIQNCSYGDEQKHESGAYTLFNKTGNISNVYNFNASISAREGDYNFKIICFNSDSRKIEGIINFTIVVKEAVLKITSLVPAGAFYPTHLPYETHLYAQTTGGIDKGKAICYYIQNSPPGAPFCSPPGNKFGD